MALAVLRIATLVVVLWDRMGTPLPAELGLEPDKQPYRSGTEWEFEDGRAAKRQVLSIGVLKSPR